MGRMSQASAMKKPYWIIEHPTRGVYVGTEPYGNGLDWDKPRPRFRWSEESGKLGLDAEWEMAENGAKKAWNPVTVSYYNMISTPDGYRIVKFDDWWFVDQVYNITYRRGRFYCDCPQGEKAPSCRHRVMVHIFCRHRAVNSGKFYCFDTEEWFPAMENAA